jgi:hypothetical protein
MVDDGIARPDLLPGARSIIHRYSTTCMGEAVMTEPRPRFLIIPEGVRAEIKVQESPAQDGEMPRFHCEEVTVGNCEILVTCTGMTGM